MHMCAQLLSRRTTHDHRAITPHYRLGNAEGGGGLGREHGKLRAGVDERIDPAAIELHWKEQVAAQRTPCRDPKIGLGPGRRSTRTGLLAIKDQTVTRQIEIDVEAA